MVPPEQSRFNALPRAANVREPWFKTLTSFVLLAFFTAQIGWAQDLKPVDLDAPAQTAPVISLQDMAPWSPAAGGNSPQTSVDFLKDTLTLDAPDSKETENKGNEDYELERYDFAAALDQLRPEYASAVIVKDLQEEDLARLADLDFETAILVLHGETVIVTSGSEDEIGTLPAAKELIEKSELISHTHPGSHSSEGPSGLDLNEAVEAPAEEYVITHQGVYAYNREGVLNGGQPYSYEWYLARSKDAKALSSGDQVQARAELNTFIAQQDQYNQAGEEDRAAFRRGGTLSYTAGLGSSSLTTLPGSPYPYLMSGSSAGTSLSGSSDKFFLNYSVSPSEVSGFTLSFDNATTPGVEVQNISALSTLTFGFKGPNTSVKVEIVDINNVKDVWTLTNISNSSEEFWQIPVASISNTLDKTKIKQINFIVGAGNTVNTSGTLTIRAKGVNTSSPAEPAITSSVPLFSNQTTLTLSGTKEANTSIFINNVEAVAASSSTVWTATVNLISEGNNNVSVKAQSVIGKTSSGNSFTVKRDTLAPAGSLEFNPAASYTETQAVTLRLTSSDSGTGVDKMSFSFDGSNWSVPESDSSSKTLTLPSGDGIKTVYVKFYDKAGNESPVYSQSITLDTLAPAGSLSIGSGAAAVNQNALTLHITASDAGSGLDKMSFSSDGSTWTAADTFEVTKLWTLPDGDGNKMVYVKFQDKSGKWSDPVSASVLLDTVPPTGSLTINAGAAETDSLTVTLGLSVSGDLSGAGTMSFSTDGVNWSVPENYENTRAFTLPEGAGNKTVFVKLTDKAGNAAVFSGSILYQAMDNDGTQFIYQSGTVIQETTPQGDILFYRPDGSLSSFRFADGREIQYPNDTGRTIQIFSSEGVLLETIASPSASALAEDQAVKLSLEGGLDAYYVNGTAAEFRTAAGIRITDVTFDAQENLTDALFTYPDGTREIIRSGFLLRRIAPNGMVTDFMPTHFTVRDIFPGRTDYYVYDKISQDEIRGLRVFGTEGNESFYDELGILRKVLDASGKIYEYTRAEQGTGFVTSLDAVHSSDADEMTLTGGLYDASGAVTELHLENGQTLLFENGRLQKTVDSNGQEVQYSYEESQGVIAGLQVTRQGTTFSYDDSGFLKTISTDEGVITRTLTDQETIQILLDEVGGNTLSDFELDSDGHILSGIVTTKEGIKQRIENGVLTGFETVDGRNYKMQGQEALLESWNFQDGTSAFYAGTSLSQILFPDGTRLHTIGFSSQKQIQSFVEELPDGTEKFFSVLAQESGGTQKLRLSKMITPSGTEIHYGGDGLASEVILPDSSSHQVRYSRDAQGEVESITFESQDASRTFSPSGELMSLLHEGVRAEVADGEVSRLLTRFGEIIQPEWTPEGVISGQFQFVDGTRQVIENGNLIQTIRPDGKKVNYENGRVQSIQTQEAVYELVYQDAETGLENVRMKIHSVEGVLEVPLIPYLLNPEYFRAENWMGHSVQYRGGAVLDSQDYKFGTAALKLDGAGDYLEILDGSSEGFQCGSADFTIDFWFNADAPASGAQKLWSQYTAGSGTNVISIYLENGILKASFEKGGQPWGGAITGGTVVGAGTWNHAALVRNGNQVSLYLNGQKQGEVTVSGDAPSGSFYVSAGATFSGSGWNSFFTGRMDEIRISKGIARWTQNFTPPSENASEDAFTKLLLHFSQGVAPETLAEDSEIRGILLPRSLYDTLGDSSNIQSQFESGQDIFIAKMVPDTERDTVYQFGGTYVPDWGNLSVSGSFNPGFIGDSEVVGGWADMPAKASMMIDLNGDGFPDRVWTESPNQTVWKVQFNDGLQFQPTVSWTGVDAAFSQGMLEAYNLNQEHVLAALADINGDGRPDRILQKNNGEKIWYVQINNGSGFEPVRIWTDNLQPLSSAPLSATYASQARNDEGGKAVQEMIADLIDLDGDGLLDRVIRPYVAPFDHWFFQKNLGDSFADAVLWNNVDLSADADPKIAGSLSWYSTGLAQASPIAYELNAIKNQLAQAEAAYFNQPNHQAPFVIPDSIINSLNSMMNSHGASRWAYFITRAREASNFYERIDFVKSLYNAEIAESSLLIDMDGDHRPDRVFVKPQDAGNPNGRQNWFIQRNNGSGFEDAVLWDDDVRALPGTVNEKIATSLRVFNSWEDPRNVVSDLRDVTGDGLPDRVTLMKFDDGTIQNTWWVEKNNGHGFDAAEAWTGIEGGSAAQTAITQDEEHFQNWSAQVASPSFVRKVSDLIDINGDQIPDRILYRSGDAKWRVQLGTGSGFLPSTEMKIEGLKTETYQISTSRYDYLHVSLKTALPLSEGSGKVRIRLSGGDDSAEVIQEWEITDLTTAWQDFYLPMNEGQADATELKINFVPADPGAGLNPAILVDNLTFTAFRPPAAKDWLDRLLAEEDTLTGVYSDRTQTLSQYLGLSEASAPVSFNWDQLLNAETKIRFDETGQADQFETFYGSVSKVENGKVTETTLPDGSKIEFTQAESGNPQTVTQTVTHSDGSAETLQLSYGRVRTVSRPGKSPLEYSYEFNPQEVTVVYDPDTGIRERYQNAAVNGQERSQLISRTEASGVLHAFAYDAQGILISSETSYKGRVFEHFDYATAASGNRVLTTQEGVTEEYDAEGKILFHTTPEGYRYEHHYEEAQTVIRSTRTETVTLPDGTALSFDVPVVTLEEDPETGEQVHRVILSDFYPVSGEKIHYEDGKPASVLLTDGTRIVFERSEISEQTGSDSEDSEKTLRLLDAEVFFTDGTVTEFKDGKPFAAVTASGRRIDLTKEGGFLNAGTESAQFHYDQALTLWNETVLVNWAKDQPPSALPVQVEYDSAGQMLTRRFSEGVTELYEGGKIMEMIGPDGARLSHYDYDAEGNPIRIELEASRRQLDLAVQKLRAEVALSREKALAEVAEREQVLSQTLEGQYLVARDRLLEIRKQIESQADQVANLKVSGKAAASLLGSAVSSIQAGLGQVNQALEDLARQRIAVLEQLSQQVRDVSAQIETQTLEAYTGIETENENARRGILKQEISPLVYHWYRKILGRDPSTAEYDAVLAGVDFNEPVCFSQENASPCVPAGWLTDLKLQLLNSAELLQRSEQVQHIKDRVEAEVTAYLAMSDDAKRVFEQSLGIEASMLDAAAALTSAEASAVLAWLRNQSLHFGQSAYLALEAMLQSEGKPFDRETLASRLILIDILTGTLTPFEQGDLVLSLYAMKRVAAFYGLETTPLALNYAALRDLYEMECPGLSSAQPGETCALRVTAHINGNHYVILTKVTDQEVTFLDPGAGAEGALERTVLSAEAFLQVWTDTKTNSGFGYVLSPRAPPESQSAGDSALEVLGANAQFRVLSAREQQSVRGAFFVLILPAILAVAAAVVSAVGGAIAAVVSIIGGLVSAIGSIVSGFVSGFLAGGLLGGIQGLFTGVLAGLGNIAAGLAGGISLFANGLSFAFQALQWGIVAGLQGLAFQVPFIGPALAGYVGSSAFGSFVGVTLAGLALQGTGKLLEAAGVSPKITQTVIAGGKIVMGVGLLASGNPSGLLAGLGLAAGGTSEFLSLHTSLSPTVSGIIGLSAAAVGAFAGAGFHAGSLTGALSSFKTALPFLSQQFASIGVTSLGSSLGLDWRLTSLISTGVRAAVGSIVGNVFGNNGTVVGYRDDGTAIIVSNPKDLGDFIGGAIQTAPREISFNVGSGGGISEGSFTPIDIDGSIVNQPGLFSKIFNTLKDAAISTANFLGPVALAATPSLIDSFNQKQMNDGLSQTLNDNVTTVFDRPTIENIYNTQGGIDSILAQGSTPITLPDGATAKGYKFSDSTTLIFDDSSNFLGQLRNGRYELGDFAINGNGEFVLKGGVILEDIGDGNVLQIEVQNGKIGNVTVRDAADLPIVRIEGDTEPIFIKGPDEEISFGNNFKIEFGPIQLGFELGKLTKVAVDATKSTPAQTSGTGETLYALTNGILNTELFSSPGYLLNLMDDIVNQSNGSTGIEDIILAPTFFSSGLLAAWNAVGTLKNLLKLSGFGIAFDAIFGEVIDALVNFIKDTVMWAAETFDPNTMGAAALNVWNALENYFRGNPDDRARDLVGVGYSGGFLTLGEVLVNNVYNEQANVGYNAVSLVGLGGANIQLDGPYRKVLDKIVEIGEILLKGSVKTAEFLSNIRIELDALAGLAAGPAGLASLSQTEVDQVYRELVEDAVESAYQLFIAKAQEKTQLWNGFAPSLAATSKIGVVVNVYGSQDILTKLSVGSQTIGGYRDSLGAYSITNDEKALVNVEIVGASHFDYIRPEETNQWWKSGLLGSVASAVDWFTTTEDEIWNGTVADFVAQLVNHSQSSDDVDIFLRANPDIASFDGQKWTIRLPGWESRA